MSYITITTDVNIDLDEISDDDLIEIIEYKLSLYKGKKDPSAIKYLKDFKKVILEALNYDTAGEAEDEEGSVQDWLKDKTLNALKTKYTLNELETFLNNC